MLRRPLGPKQYTAIRYADHFAAAGALAYSGTVGDSYDAMDESVVGALTMVVAGDRSLARLRGTADLSVDIEHRRWPATTRR